MMIMVSEPHYTLTIEYYLVAHEDSAMTAWSGYKLVGDNIDKTVRPSFERINSHFLSLHYYHTYAVLDRIGVSDLNSSVYDVSLQLPSSEE